HAIPSERIEKIEMLGQAGSMLNLKSLADIAIDNIVIGSAFPKPILLGEIAGVNGSEVSERSYFALLDRDHTELEWFVKQYFKKDIQVRRIFRKVKKYTIDWGIREVFNKSDEAEYRQKRASNAVAIMEFATMDEARKEFGLPPIGGEEGDIIMGMLPYYEFLFNMSMAMAAVEEMGEQNTESQGATSMKQKNASTSKKAASVKDLEKNKRVAPPTRDSIQLLKDSINGVRKTHSVRELCEKWEVYDKTVYKILNWAKRK
ncbi:hypothetical protein LCGC14_2259620, partial [marine sediment metagenome]